MVTRKIRVSLLGLSSRGAWLNSDRTYGSRLWIHVSCALLLFACVSSMLVSAQAQGPGLYKDGEKVVDLKEILQAEIPADVRAFGKQEAAAARFLQEVFGSQVRGESNHKSQFAHGVMECRALVQSIVSAYPDGPIPREERKRVLALSGALQRSHEIVLDALDRVEMQLIETDVSVEKRERHALVCRRLRSDAEKLLGKLELFEAYHVADDDRGIVDILLETHRYLQEESGLQALSAPPTPSFSPVLLESRAPRLVAVDESSVARTITYPPVPGRRGIRDAADLEETIDVQFTDEIVELAAELNHAPVEIYAYVHDNLAFECYVGSRKGSQQTLEHMRGNDHDQASLLIALLRVSGIPARYASGRLKITSDQANNWLGFEDVASAALMLNSNGFDVLAYVYEDEIYALEFDRVWVEAFIPMINYRGAPNEDIGPTWAPLDPAFRQYQNAPSVFAYGEIGFDAEAFVEDYYSTYREETPIDLFRQQMLDWLAVHHPGASYEDMIRGRAVITESDGIIPGTLAAELMTYDGSFSEIPSDMRYRIRFHVHGSGSDLDYSTSLPELALKQLTLSYIGATPADQQIIDDAGGIWHVQDPYLVDLKPVLKIDGCEVATGSGAVMMGMYQNSDMHFTPPSGAPVQIPVVYNNVIAGNYQGFGIDTEDALPAYFDVVDTACEEEYMGEVVHQTALAYLNNVDTSDDEMAALMHVVLTNDVSEAILENTITVLMSGGLPITFDWTGMLVDADRKIIGSYSAYGEDHSCDVMRLGGADGSIQENRVFETVFDEEAISTIKILQLANDLGIGVCTITSTDIYGDCPGFNQPQDVVDQIMPRLSAGQWVTIPLESFTYHLWGGTAWIDMDPISCAAGYIIYGGHDYRRHDGGATVDEWLITYPELVCLGVEPPGVVDVDPPATDNLYCPDNPAYWTFTVRNLRYIGKDDEGNCVQLDMQDKVFPVDTYTIKQLAEDPKFGPGEYVFRVGGEPSICPECVRKEETVTILEIDFIRQDNSEFPDACDDACHMVSKFTTSANLPNSANFEGPTVVNTGAGYGSGRADLHTFRVQVKGIPAEKTPKIRIDITGSVAYSHEFDMVHGTVGGTSTFRTDEHVRLVSNAVDDAHLAHQTPLVKLGDNVTATLVLGGGDLCSKSFPVARPSSEAGTNAIRTAASHFVVVDYSDVAANADVPATTERMTQAWAQAAAKHSSSSRTRTPVRNVIRIRGAALGGGTFAVEVDGVNVPAFAIAASGRRSPSEIAEDIATGINAVIGAGQTAAFNTAPSWGTPVAHVVVKKGSDVVFANLAETVPGTTISIPVFSTADNDVEFQDEEPCLAANYGDGDGSNTMDFFIVKTLGTGNRGDAWTVGYCGAASDMRNTSYIVLTAGDAAADNSHTAAHEAGRFLMNYDGLHSGAYNLMNGTSSTDTILARKRLTRAQHQTSRTENDGSLLKP